ncbi:hypothetical protein LXL04_001928 [Taraxacum kok-saghyz]
MAISLLERTNKKIVNREFLLIPKFPLTYSTSPLTMTTQYHMALLISSLLDILSQIGESKNLINCFHFHVLIYVYLITSGFDTSHSAARSYDRVAIKFRGNDADINFDLSDNEEDMAQVRSK